MPTESHCPYCSSDTSDSAWIHPELGLRYCSRACIDSHVGMGRFYRVSEPDWAVRAQGATYRAEDCPAEWAGMYEVVSPDEAVNVSDAIPGVPTCGGGTPAYPVVCGGCSRPFSASAGDRPSAAYPYCSRCHWTGEAFNVEHAELLATLRGYGLRPAWWHTGGGCWTLILQRQGAPDRWASEEEDGSDFVPFVCATDAFEDEDGAWHVEAGLPKRGEPFGAAFYADESSWCGELGTDAPCIVPAGAHALASFALRHLPTS